MMRNWCVLAGACALMVSSGAAAQKAAENKVPAQVQQLLACRGIADTSQRLACFDRQSAAVDQAISTRDIVMIDRERVRETRRSLFGLSVPSFGGLFGDGGEDEVKEIQSTVAGAGRNYNGGLVVSLADGSTWSQTDDRTVAISPKRGHKAVVRRGTLGSFYMRLDGQPGVKVERVR